jgi:hypothetical protein
MGLSFSEALDRAAETHASAGDDLLGQGMALAQAVEFSGLSAQFHPAGLPLPDQLHAQNPYLKTPYEYTVSVPLISTTGGEATTIFVKVGSQVALPVGEVIQLANNRIAIFPAQAKEGESPIVIEGYQTLSPVEITGPPPQPGLGVPAFPPVGQTPSPILSVGPQPPGYGGPELGSGYGISGPGPYPPSVWIIPTIPPGVFSFLGASRR